jgi:hypothetical protein
MLIAHTAFWIKRMRRSGLYAALALCVYGLPATAADQYGQWSLERLHSNVVTLTYTQSIPRDDNDVVTAELGFICIRKDGPRTFGATLLPSEGGYENAQGEVTVLIHKGERYGSSDLSQKWQSSRDYLFLDLQDEIGALVGYLKTNEANSEKFVYLSFSCDHLGRTGMLNVINVDLSGFSKGIVALDTACAAPR